MDRGIDSMAIHRDDVSTGSEERNKPVNHK